LNISSGKRSGLSVVADGRGVIAALAIDQRSALRKLFAKASGQPAEEISADLLIAFKEQVSRFLTPHASAILLDPEYGLPAAAQRKANCGLLLAYEKTGFDTSTPGRLPALLPGFSVAKLQQAGADAIKVLLYYSPFSAAKINTSKYDWVEQVGEECHSVDVPFFLELVSYNDDMDDKGPEFARIKPEVVTRSVEKFCDPRFAVDVLKVGVPVNMNYVESAKISRSAWIYSREESRAHFRRASQAASLPFIYLSEGVSNETFSDALVLATEAGSSFSGVLCGRAIWQGGVPVFAQHGAAALENWLQEHGVRNIQNVNAHLAAARPWFDKFSLRPRSEG
jgi:tagatose 1,6-diphosphate aldolase